MKKLVIEKTKGGWTSPVFQTREELAKFLQELVVENFPDEYKAATDEMQKYIVSQRI